MEGIDQGAASLISWFVQLSFTILFFIAPTPISPVGSELERDCERSCFVIAVRARLGEAAASIDAGG